MASDGAVNGACKGAIATAFKPQVVVPASKAAEAVEFYKAAFGAIEVARAAHPKRKAEQESPLLCVELKIRGASFLVCDQAGDAEPAVAEAGVILFRLEVEDVEAAVEAVVKAGASKEGDIVKEESACFADLVGKVKDPFGVVWIIASSAKACGRNDSEISAGLDSFLA